MLRSFVTRLLHHFPLTAGRLRTIRYRARLARGEPAGEIRYVSTDGGKPPSREVSLCSTLTEAETERWRTDQTLKTLTVSTQTSPDNGWFLAPGAELGAVPPAWLESALMIASTETIDAVAMGERIRNAPTNFPESAEVLLDFPWRALTLFSAEKYRWDAGTDSVRTLAPSVTAKVIDRTGVGSEPPRTSPGQPLRRGPYVGNEPLPATMEIGLRTSLPSAPAPENRMRPNILVTAPFLARGGAEHTLFETMAVLRSRCRVAFATLAPHREELGDRRADFEGLSPLLYSLGDWVHPDAMIPMLLHLIDRLNIDIFYNANGTTLFYDFAPQLKAARPELRIIDHLYDHRVGYIERYRDPDLLKSVDSCIAENHPIADVLTGKYGWPPHRAPVVWSCGRSSENLPPPSEHETIRRELRQELGYTDSDVVFLTAARMHEQKRPLDLVRLAEKFSKNPSVHFLIAGGGPLEETVDRAISLSAAPGIRRLPFRTDIPDLILAADVGLLVSDFEGLPVFLLECLQLGRPFLGTDVGDLGRVLRDTGAGLVVERPGDIEALTEAVTTMTDPGARRDFSRNAAEAAAQFSPEHCARIYAQALFGDRPAS